MNNQELKEAERKELKEIREKMTEENCMDIFEESAQVRQKYRILRTENRIITEYGFACEEWASLSQSTKTIILDMVVEADRYEQLRGDLQGWLEEAP